MRVEGMQSEGSLASEAGSPQAAKDVEGGRITRVVLLASGLVLGLVGVLFASAVHAGDEAPRIDPRRVVADASSPQAPLARVVSPSRGARLLVHDKPMNPEDLAEALGMEYRRASSHVYLSDCCSRVRLYLGSRDATINAERLTLKEETEVKGGDVVVPAVVVRYVSRRVAEFRRTEINTRRTVAKAPPPKRKPVAKAFELPELPPVSSRKRREAAANRPTPKPIVRPQPLQNHRPDVGWTPRIPERSWRWIVIHHSDDATGNAEKFDRVHRDKGWEHGLGYHFVIGNGSLSGDGQVEVGPRWHKQLHGAHARDYSLGDNRYNEQGIGICLVGDFEKGSPPSARQIAQLTRLVRWLSARYGVEACNIIRHSDCVSTKCPGALFPWSRFTRNLNARRSVPAAPAIAQAQPHPSLPSTTGETPLIPPAGPVDPRPSARLPGIR